MLTRRGIAVTVDGAFIQKALGDLIIRGYVEEVSVDAKQSMLAEARAEFQLAENQIDDGWRPEQTLGHVVRGLRLLTEALMVPEPEHP